MANKKTDLSVPENLLASGVGVLGATMMTHPIDVVKVRLQLAKTKNAAAESFSLSRFVQMWPRLLKKEGPKAFVAGMQSGAMRAVTYGTARIGLCEPLEARLGSKTGGALAAGVLATVVGNPFEVLKVRLQARPREAEGGEFRAMQRLVKEEGVSALARGFQWAAARAALLTASQVVPYGYAKNYFRPIIGKDGVSLHLASSLVAGVVTCTVTAPVDVMKTKVMSAASGEKRSSVGELFKKHGPMLFFKGWLANYVRIGPQTLFIFLFFEQAKSAIKAVRY